MKARLILPLFGALVALLPGCGGSSSSPNPAALAPPDALVFVEGTVRPSGQSKANVDAIAKEVAGIENLGDFIVSKLESKARAEGEPLDFATEVEPWLGRKAAVWWDTLSEGNLSDAAFAVETTDPKATQGFIDKQAKAGRHRTGGGSYKGVEYTVDRSGGTYAGVVGDFLVSAEGERAFKAAVDASQGESLARQDRYKGVASAEPNGALANAYVDVGGLIGRSGKKVDPAALRLLEVAGIDPREAAALASVVPGSNQLEVDVSSRLSAQKLATGDASQLLGSLPGDSFAAFAAADFGKQLGEAVNDLDASGIPPELPPHQLKSALLKVGIDLEKVAASIHGGAVFATGADKRSLGGALVLMTDDPHALAQTISSIGLLVSQSTRSAKVLVTPLSGRISGFSVSGRKLGPKPVVVATGSDRLVVAYGMPAAEAALSAKPSSTLSGNPDYTAAAASLGSTPISGFVDGPGALRLAEALVPPSSRGFQQAKPFLAKIRFIAIGAEGEGSLAKAKLIVGLGR